MNAVSPTWKALNKRVGDLGNEVPKQKHPENQNAGNLVSLIVAILFTFLFWLVTLPVRYLLRDQ